MSKNDPDSLVLHSEDDSAEHEDVVTENLETFRKEKKYDPKKKKISVSGECYGEFNKLKPYEPKEIKKSAEVEDRIRARLQSGFMFSNLDKKEQEIVIKAMNICHYKKGDMVIKQGDNGFELFIIDKGTLECFKKFPGSDKDTFLKTYEPGESFGELALLYNVPRAASIRALEDCTLYSLDRECFNNIVKGASMRKREKYENFLKKIEILKDLNFYELNKLCDALKTKEWKKGDNIIKQGEDGNDFYIIFEGQAIALKNSEIVFDYKDGGYFGELSLIRNTPRAASIIVTSPTLTTVSIDRLSFERILGSIKEILKRNTDMYEKYVPKSIKTLKDV